MKYHELIPHAFKRFSVLKALRTGIPTIKHTILQPTLAPSDKPALCTMNILPPMMTVWYHFAKRALGDRVDIVIFDCSGTLKKSDFPGARVLKYLNLYAATKCDIFLYSIAKHRKIGWICDDDMFLLDPSCIDHLQAAFDDPQTASLSFRPRTWWEFEIAGKRHPVSSSYCTAINREIFCDKEHLSLAPVRGNPHPPTGGKKPKSFDTFDKANETLLEKGYRCAVLGEEERKKCITGFSGVSNGVMLLNYFRTPEQTIDYFRSPKKKQWEGSVLDGAFGAMLAIDAVQDLYEKITGKRYPLPSLPSKTELQRLRMEFEPLLGSGRSWRWIDDVQNRLNELL